MIGRIAIMVVALVLAVPEYGHGPQSDAGTAEPALREAATAATREIVETLVDTLDFEQVAERHFDPDALESAARIAWFAEMVGVDGASEVDQASIRRAYVGTMNVLLLQTFYQTALESPESSDEVALPPDVAAVARETRFLCALDDPETEDVSTFTPEDLEQYADECEVVAASLRAHVRAIVEDPEQRARIVDAFSPYEESHVGVGMGAAEIGVPEETRVVWVRVGDFTVIYVERNGALEALALLPYLG